MIKNFTPVFGSGQIISATTTSSSVTLSNKNESLCMSNIGSDAVYIKTGEGSATATNADYPVLPGQQVTMMLPEGHDTVAALANATSSSVQVMVGEGI